jgi:omega-6 fatty acid desaturase (delta-12 desaturase)
VSSLPPETADPTTPTSVSVAEWRAIVAEFQVPSLGRAIWQLINTVGVFILLWALMYWSRSVSFWLTAALAVLAGGFLVRVFIIFHDCGHGSFFASRTANDAVGFLCGMLTFTPYYHWRWEHSLHHASSGDLDRRGVGDIWTMTVQEYLAAPRWKRFAYQLARNPIVLFLLAPAALFLVRERFPSPGASPRDRNSVWWMNAALAVMVGSLCWLFGWKSYLLIQLTITMVGGAIGVWMFYVQHQFDDAYWARNEEWDYTTAALQGSSFYRLPKILQWFSGNIGFHHIHHLSPRIPNYNLERCHESHPIFTAVKPLTIRRSLKSINLHLWDEQARQLVSFGQMRRGRRRQPQAA